MNISNSLRDARKLIAGDKRESPSPRSYDQDERYVQVTIKTMLHIVNASGDIRELMTARNILYLRCVTKEYPGTYE